MFVCVGDDEVMVDYYECGFWVFDNILKLVGFFLFVNCFGDVVGVFYDIYDIVGFVE